ncbi:MAG TPA: response regulator [Thermomicrobiales bacterium]|nr:response regulator [Thermomicrobiales bacterium]
MGATILVVDDEPALVDVLLAVLALEGYQVRGAPDGLVALALVAQARPDLLVTDQHMPRLGGVTLITRLQAAPDLGIPAILMSAGAPPALPPLTTFLPKPFDLDHLLDVVATLLATPGPSGVPEAQ